MEKYRERAAEAEAQARRARNEREREAFLEVARLWRSLADSHGEKPAEQTSQARD